MRSVGKTLRTVLGAALVYLPGFSQGVEDLALALELDRRCHIFAVIAGDRAEAEHLLNFAKETAARLARRSLYTQSYLLPVLCDEITRWLVHGLSPDYIMEHLGAIETVEDLQRTALAPLLPETTA